MNIFFISYSNIEYDGRTQELLKIAQSLGSVSGIVVGNGTRLDTRNVCQYKPNNGFSDFVKCTIDLYHKQNHVDCIFVDNRRATVPANLLYIIFHPAKVIYDMRELYIAKEIKHLSGKIGCIPEMFMVRHADIVICANKERTEYVKSKFKPKQVITYENLRRLEYSNNAKTEVINEKYKSIFKKCSFKIISTSGTSRSRGNDKLILALKKINTPVDVYLVGAEEVPGDNNYINRIIKENDLSNVHLLGRVNHDELKWLIDHCDCGVVNYHSKDINNKFCASGKLYEFLFEGKPVITTSNPPLKNMTEKYGIGCSGEDYVSLIQDMIENHSKYERNLIKYIETISVKKSNMVLINHLKDLVNNK